MKGSVLEEGGGVSMGHRECRSVNLTACDSPKVHMSCPSSFRDSQCLDSSGVDVHSPGTVLPAPDTSGKRVEYGHT